MIYILVIAIIFNNVATLATTHAVVVGMCSLQHCSAAPLQVIGHFVCTDSACCRLQAATAGRCSVGWC